MPGGKPHNEAIRQIWKTRDLCFYPRHRCRGYFHFIRDQEKLKQGFEKDMVDKSGSYWDCSRSSGWFELPIRMVKRGIQFGREQLKDEMTMTNTGMIDTGKECKSFPQPTKSNSNTDIALKRLGFSYPQGKFHLQIREEVVIASALAEAQGHKGMFNFRDRHFINAIRTGQTMEDIAKELKAVNQEVSESKTILKNLSNEISAIQDIVHPQLIKQIKEIRESRMSLVSEVGESLKTLRDIRKFFLETDYEKEMERLERFIRVCKEILELKRNGIFDDICDSAIRMAVREEKKEEKHERE